MVAVTRRFDSLLLYLRQSRQPKEDFVLVTSFSAVHTTFNISRVMYRHKIKTVGLWPRKISSFLQPVVADTGIRKEAGCV